MKPNHIITEISFKDGSIQIEHVPVENSEYNEHELIFMCKILLIAAFAGLGIGFVVKFL